MKFHIAHRNASKDNCFELYLILKLFEKLKDEFVRIKDSQGKELILLSNEWISLQTLFYYNWRTWENETCSKEIKVKYKTKTTQKLGFLNKVYLLVE